MINLESHAQEINRLHQLAHQFATNAVINAITAGELLHEAKRQLKHGQFQQWVKKTVNVSLRQAQRYMAAAEGKHIALNHLIISDKNDTVSHLKPVPKKSTGTWTDGRWIPDRGFFYLFKEDKANYWVSSAPNGGFHVCKHYSGEKMSSAGFYMRYTVLAVNTDEDLTSQFYIGTRYAPLNARCINDILNSYGLKDIKGSLLFGFEDNEPSDRPWCEPEPENWYWDSKTPDDGLYEFLKEEGLPNQNGTQVLS
jgi:hypothetical protein